MNLLCSLEYLHTTAKRIAMWTFLSPQGMLYAQAAK